MALTTTANRRYRQTPIAAPVVTTRWKDLINNDQIVPFVSASLDYDRLSTEPFEQLVKRWGESIEYPEADLTLVAQYLSSKSSVTNAGAHYLSFVKRDMYDRASKALDEHLAKVRAGQARPEDGISEIQLAKAGEKINEPGYSLTDLAYDLGCLDQDPVRVHPLQALASLPIRIFITTSFHRFLEVALFQANKQPVSEFYRWNPLIHLTAGSIFEQNPSFEPTEERPLVYHLFGRDDQPESLVISENDHLDLLTNLSFEICGSVVGHNTDAAGKPVVQGLPASISKMLDQRGTAPLLLGYDLGEWEFRVLFRGLILATRQGKKFHRGEGIFIQLVRPVGIDAEAELIRSLEKYLKYFSKEKIIWGTADTCLKELCEAM